MKTPHILPAILFVSPDLELLDKIQHVQGEKFPNVHLAALPALPKILHPFSIIALPSEYSHTHPSLAQDIPVIFYGDVKEMPAVFLQGCFDYLSDPWYPEELFYRALRSTGQNQVQILGVQIQILPSGLKTNTKHLPLTSTECTLLSLLLKSKGNITYREALEKAIPRDSSVPSRRIDAHIARLRKKLRSLSPSPCPDRRIPIIPARGKGYYLTTD